MSTIRETIINEIGPTNMALADREKVLALGEAAVPVLIDLFQNPSTPYGDINQATAADALIEFSKKGNKDADAFIKKIALGKVPLTASWGREAQQIVQQHFKWIGVDPAEVPKSAQPVPATPAPELKSPVGVQLPKSVPPPPPPIPCQPPGKTASRGILFLKGIAFAVAAIVVWAFVPSGSNILTQGGRWAMIGGAALMALGSLSQAMNPQTPAGKSKSESVGEKK